MKDRSVGGRGQAARNGGRVGAAVLGCIAFAAIAPILAAPVEGSPLPTAAASGVGPAAGAGNGMSASKLSLHSGLGSLSLDFVQKARPRMIKVLDAFGDKPAQLKRMVPGIYVIGRIYLASQPTDGDPKQRAAEWWSGVQATVLAAQGVDSWEGYNEINPSDAEAMAWYAAFEAARVGILAQHGLNATIGSFSVGWPDVTNATLMAAFYPAIDAARAHGGILGLHEYSSPLLSSCFNKSTGVGWTTGRYRHWYELYLKPTGRVLPLVITEFGISDAGCPSSGLGGWLNHCGLWASKYGRSDCAAFYVQQMAWYDSVLRQDSYVMGATLFQQDIPGWASKDATKALPDLIAYMNGVH